MIVWAAGAGAALTWAAGFVLLVSHRRRGLALGLAGLGVGMGLAGAADGHWALGAGLAGGGLVTAALRMRSGDPGWGLLPAGSTPRIILACGALVAAMWLGNALPDSIGSWPTRVAVLVAAALAGARLLTTSRRDVALASASALALAAGGAGLLVNAGGPAGLAIPVMAAILIGLLPSGISGGALGSPAGRSGES